MLVIGTVYGLIFQLPAYLERRKNYPKEQIAAIHAAVAENSVLLSSLSSVDGGNSDAPEAVARIQSELQESRDNLRQLLLTPPEGLTEEIRTNIESLLRQQEAFLKDYDLRYAALQKPLSYDPSDDLGGLDVNAKSDEIAARARLASQKLTEVANQPTLELAKNPGDGSFVLNAGTLQLSQEAVDSLRSSAVCLSGLESQALARSPTLPEAIAACDEQYVTAKRLCLASVAVVFSSDTGRALTIGYTDTLQSLDRLIGS